MKERARIKYKTGKVDYLQLDGVIELNTRLLDREGRNIFEGDVVEWKPTSREKFSSKHKEKSIMRYPVTLKNGAFWVSSVLLLDRVKICKVVN